VLAGEVLKIYTYAKEVDCSKRFFDETELSLPAAKGTPEDLVMAREVVRIQSEGGNEAVSKAIAEGRIKFDAGQANRYIMLENQPDEIKIYVSALGFGDIILIGFPGEPFNKIGRLTKESSPFDTTLIACMANGSMGYYPTEMVYDEGGDEASVSRFVRGTAELLAKTAIKLSDALYKENNNVLSEESFYSDIVLPAISFDKWPVWSINTFF
jgi:hypothetical protein